MPKRKSAEDIRRQTNRICKAALESLSRGGMDKRVFAQRIARVTKVEKTYTDNIHRQPQYIIEVRKDMRKADAIPYLKSEYTGHESVLGTR